MPQDRPSIPRPMQRALKEESGYRCAIPTCGQTAALQLAHIEPWAKIQEHTFDNLIVLCAICHARFDSGEMPKSSILQYKRNLSLLTHRYSQTEYRLLTFFANHLDEDVLVSSLDKFVFGGLIEDGHLEAHPGGGMRHSQMIFGRQYEFPPYWIYALTDSGVDIVNEMINAEAIE